MILEWQYIHNFVYGATCICRGVLGNRGATEGAHRPEKMRMSC